MPNIDQAVEALKLLQSWSLWLLGIHTGAIGFLSVLYVRGGKFPSGKRARSVIVMTYLFFGLSVLTADFVQGGIPSLASQLLFVTSRSEIPKQSVFAFTFPRTWSTTLYFWVHLQTLFVFLGVVLFAVSVWIRMTAKKEVNVRAAITNE